MEEKRKQGKRQGSRSQNYPLYTMKNLPQFRNKPHEEVRQYILKTKGVDIGSDLNWNNTIV